MKTVTVTPAQAEALNVNREFVEVRDESGKVLGFFAPLSLEYAKEYAEAAAKSYSVWGPDGPPRSNGPSYTSEQVAAHLKALEEKYGTGEGKP